MVKQNLYKKLTTTTYCMKNELDKKQNSLQGKRH